MRLVLLLGCQEKLACSKSCLISLLRLVVKMSGDEEILVLWERLWAWTTVLGELWGFFQITKLDSFCKPIIFSKYALVVLFFSKPIEDQYSGRGNVLLYTSVPWSYIGTIWEKLDPDSVLILMVMGRLYSTEAMWMTMSEVDVFVLKSVWAICSYMWMESGRQESLLIKLGLAA